MYHNFSGIQSWVSINGSGHLWNGAARVFAGTHDIPLPDNRHSKLRNNENNDQAAPRIPVNGQLARLGGPEEGAILDAWSM